MAWDLFVYNAADGIRSLDPARATDLETLWIVDQLYEGLLEFDAALLVVPASQDLVCFGGWAHPRVPAAVGRGVPRRLPLRAEMWSEFC